jgi:hypothetical protein
VPVVVVVAVVPVPVVVELVVSAATPATTTVSELTSTPAAGVTAEMVGGMVSPAAFTNVSEARKRIEQRLEIFIGNNGSRKD